jgi:hypothetical protein
LNLPDARIDEQCVDPPRPVPTFLAEWITPAGMNSTSPAFRTTGGFAVERVCPHAFEDIDDLFARMRVPGRRRSRLELDDHLDDLASGDAQVVPLEIDASGSD